MGRATLPPEAPEQAPFCLRLLSSLRLAWTCVASCMQPSWPAFLFTQATSSHHSNLILTVDPQPDPTRLSRLTYITLPLLLSRTRCLSMVPGDTRPLLFLCKSNTLQSLTWPLLHILQSSTQSTLPRHASLDLCLPPQDESGSSEHRLRLSQQPPPLRSCVVMGNSVSPGALIGRMGMVVQHCPHKVSWT